MLDYFLESNLYFLEYIDLILYFLENSVDTIENELFEFANNKIHKQGGRYSLTLNNSQIKKYLSYSSDEKCACVVFLLWLGLLEQDIKELTTYRKKDILIKPLPY